MDEPTTFGQQLRRLRQQRGLSLRELAKRALHAKTLIGDRENGKRTPTADVAARLDQLLDGGGVLTAAAEQLATDNATPARLAHVAAAPRTVDAASVDALAGVLANMRRLEDSVGAGPLIAATAGQLKLLESLAEEARGPIRARVVDLAGQWGAVRRLAARRDRAARAGPSVVCADTRACDRGRQPGPDCDGVVDARESRLGGTPGRRGRRAVRSGCRSCGQPRRARHGRPAAGPRACVARRGGTRRPPHGPCRGGDGTGSPTP